MPRNVPEEVLDKILGKSKMSIPSTEKKKDGTMRKDRSIQKKSFVKEGRRSGGPVNPRGGRYKSETVREQLSGGVGTHPQEGKTSRGRDIYNEMVVKKEKRKGFPDAEAYPRLAQETIGAIGRDNFYNMPFDQAAEVLGIAGKLPPDAASRYAMLPPNRKGTFWIRQVQDMKRNPADVLAEVATGPVDNGTQMMPPEQKKSIEEDILQQMLGK